MWLKMTKKRIPKKDGSGMGIGKNKGRGGCATSKGPRKGYNKKRK